MFMLIPRRIPCLLAFILGAGLLEGFTGRAQIDPIYRNLLELGYDQPINGQGPQGIYAYYYYNRPDFIGTNIALRMAIAPLYVDGELGFKHLISPTTDVGLGFYGGLYGENYYDVQQGDYLKQQSFNGSGGGASLSIYQLVNPGMLIPVNVVARGGMRDVVFSETSETAGNFQVPDNQIVGFTRAGIRVAGKQPLLRPELGLELSVWYEHQWRLDNQSYGYSDDRSINPNLGLYWLYAGFHYAFTNTGQNLAFAFTAGGSTDADQLGAWRLGGVLPLVAEFPLMMPGYYYEELTATRFQHFYGSYDIPLESSHRFQFRLEAATAHLTYLSGFEQPSSWQSGVGGGLTFAPKQKNFQIILRYGYGFNAIRNGHEGANSVGVLFQYNFEARKKSD
jgi:hypothetical protein